MSLPDPVYFGGKVLQALVTPLDSDRVRLGDRTVPRRLQVEVVGALTCQLILEVVGDRPQCREIRFISQPDGREVRQSDLERVRLADEIERWFAFAARQDAEGVSNWLDAIPGIAKTVGQARQGQAPRKLTRQFLEEVADVYRRNVDDRPTQTVAEAFGIAHSTAAEYVRRARAAGLLPRTTSGKRKA